MISNKNKKRILFLCVLVTIIFLYKQWKKPKLQCNEVFVKEIKTKYNADSILLIPTVFQEEIYFEELRSITVAIFNPTTRSLDFKKYKEPEEFDNYEKVYDELQIEGEKISKIVYKNCSCEGFNNIMIVFLKRKPKSNQDIFYFSYSYDNCR